mmetsp:Transcript_32730/g.97699  ORF Transcript_32730/g.97699 Transcript_32730/m.97699 type:complete len:341 (-) Transcript_32730:174-1196(-)
MPHGSGNALAWGSAAATLGAALGFAAGRWWDASKRSQQQESTKEIVHDHIRSHRSIRKFKQDRPVSKDTLERLLHVALRSSNNGNMQTSSVVITRDAEALKRLALIHDNGGVAKSAAVLTFCCDWSLMTRWCALRGADGRAYDNFNAFLTGALDAMVLAQSSALAAEAEGLGICFLGSTIWETELLGRQLDLPQQVHAVTSIMVGWPDEAPDERARLPLGPHVHEEVYSPLSDAGVLAHYRDRESEGWARYMQLYGPLYVAKLKAHGLDNLAQVYTTLKYSGQDFRLWSRKLLGSISAQGFSRNKDVGSDMGNCNVCGKFSHCLDPDRFSRSGRVGSSLN